MAKYKPETEPIFRYGSGLLLAVPSGCENCITQFYSKEYPNGLAVSPENYVVKNKTCYVRIPMELLENISPILVFAYELTEDKAITKTKTVLNVFDRPMPQDYVFVASDTVTYETAEALIRGLRQIKAELEELEASLEVKESELDILMEDAREILADIDTENFIKADDYNADKSATETAINNKADRVHHHNGEDVIVEIEEDNPISLNEFVGYLESAFNEVSNTFDGKADIDHTHTADDVTYNGRTLSVHLDEFAESVYGDLDTLFEEKANRDELLDYVTKESVVPYTTTGTQIATIGGKTIYAPAGGSGGSKYIFEMDGNTLVIYEEEDGIAREIFRANVGGLTRTQVQQMLSDYAKADDVDVLYGAVSGKADSVHSHEIADIYVRDGETEVPLGVVLENAFTQLAEQIPTELPNPNALTINGTSYDGSSPVSMTISGGGGGEKPWELVDDIVLEEDLNIIDLTIDGDPKEVKIMFACAIDSATQIFLTFNGANSSSYAVGNVAYAAAGQRTGGIYAHKTDGYTEGFTLWHQNNNANVPTELGNNGATADKMIRRLVTYGLTNAEWTKLRIYVTAGSIKSGSMFRVYKR